MPGNGDSVEKSDLQIKVDEIIDNGFPIHMIQFDTQASKFIVVVVHIAVKGDVCGGWCLTSKLSCLYREVHCESRGQGIPVSDQGEDRCHMRRRKVPNRQIFPTE